MNQSNPGARAGVVVALFALLFALAGGIAEAGNLDRYLERQMRKAKVSDDGQWITSIIQQNDGSTVMRTWDFKTLEPVGAAMPAGALRSSAPTVSAAPMS